MNQNTAPHSSPATADDEISLAEIYDILRAGWRPVAALALLGAGFAAVLAFALPKKYETLVYLQPPLETQYMQVNESRTSLSGLGWVSGDDLYGHFLNQLSEPRLHLGLLDSHVEQLDNQQENDEQENKIGGGIGPRQLRQHSGHNGKYAEQDQHKGKTNPEQGILYLQLGLPDFPKN